MERNAHLERNHTWKKSSLGKKFYLENQSAHLERIHTWPRSVLGKNSHLENGHSWKICLTGRPDSGPVGKLGKSVGKKAHLVKSAVGKKWQLEKFSNCDFLPTVIFTKCECIPTENDPFKLCEPRLSNPVPAWIEVIAF